MWHGDAFSLDLIGISEAFRCDLDSHLSLPGFHELITRCRDDGSRDGAGLFIKDDIHFNIRKDLSGFIPHVFESFFIEIDSKSEKSKIVGIIYRPNTPPRADVDIFSVTLYEIVDTIDRENKYGLSWTILISTYSSLGVIVKQQAITLMIYSLMVLFQQ